MDGQGSLPFVTATSPDLSKWSAWVAIPGLGDVVRHGTVIHDVPTGGLPDAAAAGPGGGAATVPVDAGNPVAPLSDEGGGASTGPPDASEAEGSTPSAISAGPSDSGMGLPGEGSPEAIAGGPSAKGGCACDVAARQERGPGGAAAVVALFVLAGVALGRRGHYLVLTPASASSPSTACRSGRRTCRNTDPRARSRSAS